MSSTAKLKMKLNGQTDVHFMQLRQTLLKCKTKNLVTLLEEWNYLSATHIENLKSLPSAMKEIAVTEIVKLCKRLNCDAEDVALLDLLYHQMYGSGEWSVYKMSGRIDSVKLLSADTLQDMLKQALKPYKAVVVVNLYKDALWSRIMMTSYSNRLNTFKVTVSFFVYYPSLPFVIVKQLKDPLLSILMEELLLIFNYTNYSKMQFSGRHIGSLATMALNHMTQTKSTLLLDVDKKRKAPVEDTWVDDPRITFVNKEQIQQREEAIAENFGNGELPILKQLEYVLTYPESETFQGLNCKVKFTGPHVIEGLRNLTRSCKIEQPMPSYLANVLLLGRDRFVLKNQ